MCHLTRRDLQWEGGEAAKQRSRADNTLGSSVSKGMERCLRTKEGQWCAIEVLSGHGTGGQKEVHVSL